jgi:hypothetical protein
LPIVVGDIGDANEVQRTGTVEIDDESASEQVTKDRPSSNLGSARSRPRRLRRTATCYSPTEPGGYWDMLTRCLQDDSLPAGVRAAGALVL